MRLILVIEQWSDLYNGAACSPTRAVFSGDYQVVTMDAVETMSTGNAFDFGILYLQTYKT